MKKKISLMLVALLAILMLCGCGEDPKTIDYNGKSYDTLLSEALQNIAITKYLVMGTQGQELDAETKKSLSEQGVLDFQFEGYKTWAELENKYDKCSQLEENAGNVVDELSSTFKITKAGNTLTTDVTLTFGEKDVIYELVYDYYDMSITSMTLNPVQTLGEKMKSAGQNTIISLAIVFFVLILISLIIKGFVIFPKLEEKKKNKAKAIEEKNAKEAPAPVIPEVVAPVQEANLMDDLELVAVITAAIAASEGTSTSGFVVRSINRR